MIYNKCQLKIRDIELEEKWYRTKQSKQKRCKTINTPQSSFSGYKVRLPLPLQSPLFVCMFGQSSWARISVHILFFTPFSPTSVSTSMEVLHRSLAVSLKLPTSGSCLYEKPCQKQRCRWDNAQVAPTQGFDCAVLYRASGRPGVLLAVQPLRRWRGEARQPEPAGTLDTEDFNVTGFSKWKLSQQSSGQRLFDTGEGLSLTSACFLAGYFASLPFSWGRAGRKKDGGGGGTSHKCLLSWTYIWPSCCQIEQVFGVTLRQITSWNRLENSSGRIPASEWRSCRSVPPSTRSQSAFPG